MVNEVNWQDFENKVGKIVKIKGRVAEEIWQHMTTIVDSHNNMEYFDLEGNYQIVVYSKEPLSREGKIELTGEVIKISGKSKDPRSKIHDDFSEYQLIVDSWKYVESD